MAPLTDTNPTAKVPANRIVADSEAALPGLVPLITLSQGEIDAIIASVPGGALNVQDIYPLSPLQEGILFHHLSGGNGDRYLITNQLSFPLRTDLNRYIAALQAIVDRHDVLRTAILWEGLSRPVQVVMRQATLLIEDLELPPASGAVSDQLSARFDPRVFRLDVRQAPLIRIYSTYDPALKRWLMVQLTHHLAVDHRSLELMQLEIEAFLHGGLEELAAPPQLRSLLANLNSDLTEEEHRVFFSQMLGQVIDPTVPFGFDGSDGAYSDIGEARLTLSRDLTRRLRNSARQFRTGPARLFHLAWAVVLAKLSGRDDVVFGTVLSTRGKVDDDSDRVIGPLVNTLPIRVRISEDSVEEGLGRIHELLVDLVRHQQTSLTIAQSCSGLPPSVRLLSALFNYRHNSAELQLRSTQADQASKGIHRLRETEYTEYPFTLSVDEFAEDYTLIAQTPSEIEPMRVCRYMATALSSLADALESAPATPIRTLRILPDEELQRVLYGWNETQSNYSGYRSVQALFESQARISPNATALVFGDAEMTFAELNQKANQLAHYLRELGVGPDERVAIYLERSFEMIVALLAVLKAGGAYVPLDPVYPEERLRFMLEDCVPVALLTRAHLSVISPNSTIPVLDLVSDAFLWQDHPTNDPIPAVTGLTPQNLAYVIYTSGSTGTPKGVAMPHEGLTNMLEWQIGQLKLSPARHVLQFAALGFDVAFQEIFSTLCSGTTLVLISEAERLDSDKWLELIVRRNIERLFLPYVALRVIAESADNLLSFGGRLVCPLKEVITAGEQLRIESSVSRFVSALDHCTLQNQYGPTETHVATSFTLSAEIPKWPLLPSIGRPIANTRVYILDIHHEPVPVGVIGELYIAGAAVARGYLHRPELTAEKFLRDPFSKEPDQRMYRTGDMGRFLPDGNIEFLGRNDFQVKIRGFRVELGEIEAGLVEHPAVREAVVVAREATPGDKRLVAYYTVSPGLTARELPAPEQFRDYLLKTLPTHMVPVNYVRMESLPLTPSGKLDRRTLPTPEQPALTANIYASPLGEIEERLAQMWAEVLQISRVGRNDDFFALGGHSLLTMRLISRIRQSLGADVSIRDLFAHPVLADQAILLEGRPGVQLPSIPQRRFKQRHDASAIITATRSDGSRIESRDQGATWYEVRTGQES